MTAKDTRTTQWMSLKRRRTTKEVTARETRTTAMLECMDLLWISSRCTCQDLMKTATDFFKIQPRVQRRTSGSQLSLWARTLSLICYREFHSMLVFLRNTHVTAYAHQPSQRCFKKVSLYNKLFLSRSTRTQKVSVLTSVTSPRHRNVELPTHSQMHWASQHRRVLKA